MTRLNSLALAGTPITDAGLEHIEGLTDLRVLRLIDTQITDAGLDRLERLTNLRALSVRNTQVTEPAMRKLCSILPTVEIDRLVEASRAQFKLFRAAEDAYEAKSYAEAIAKYEDFLNTDAGGDRARRAEIRIWMSRIQQRLAEQPDRDGVRPTAESLLKEFPKGEREFERSERDPTCVLVVVDKWSCFRVETPDTSGDAPSEQHLLRKLQEARRGDSTGNIPVNLLVRANPKSDAYRAIIALDAGYRVGMRYVDLVVAEEVLPKFHIDHPRRENRD